MSNIQHNEGEIKDGYYRLTTTQIKQLFKIGYTHIMIEERVVRVTKEQMLYKREDIEKIISEVKS